MTVGAGATATGMGGAMATGFGAASAGCWVTAGCRVATGFGASTEPAKRNSEGMTSLARACGIDTGPMEVYTTSVPEAGPEVGTGSVGVETAATTPAAAGAGGSGFFGSTDTTGRFGTSPSVALSSGATIVAGEALCSLSIAARLRFDHADILVVEHTSASTRRYTEMHTKARRLCVRRALAFFFVD